MLTDEQVASIQAEIDMALGAAQGIVGSVDPAVLPFFIVGRVVARGAPELVQEVQKLLAKADPTPEERAGLAGKIGALMHPELL